MEFIPQVLRKTNLFLVNIVSDFVSVIANDTL